MLVDSVAIGGQASTSSRIENYLGFPAGISGSDLAERAAIQASRFGARSAVPESASALSLRRASRCRARGRRAAALPHGRGRDGSELPPGSNVERLADFEGSGVYYAATQVEAQMCQGDPVVVVGGGNSPDRPRCSSRAMSAGWSRCCAAATWPRECRATSSTKWRPRPDRRPPARGGPRTTRRRRARGDHHRGHQRGDHPQAGRRARSCSLAPIRARAGSATQLSPTTTVSWSPAMPCSSCISIPRATVDRRPRGRDASAARHRR